MNNPFGIEEKSYYRLATFLNNEDRIEQVDLFGSRAMGHARKGSDIDLSLKGTQLTSKDVSHLRAIINQELPIPYSVDVVHYHSLENMELKQHIDENGLDFLSPLKEERAS